MTKEDKWGGRCRFCMSINVPEEELKENDRVCKACVKQYERMIKLEEQFADKETENDV